jgi:hypothetical protein
MGPPHDRVHGDGEILAALGFGAAVHARAIGGVGVIDDATMRANRPFRPTLAFKPLPGGFVALEMGGGKGAQGRKSSLKLKKY